MKVVKNENRQLGDVLLMGHKICRYFELGSGKVKHSRKTEPNRS